MCIPVLFSPEEIAKAIAQSKALAAAEAAVTTRRTRSCLSNRPYAGRYNFVEVVDGPGVFVGRLT